MKETTRILIPQDKVEERIQQLADEISRDYEGKVVHLVGILKGKQILPRRFLQRNLPCLKRIHKLLRDLISHRLPAEIRHCPVIVIM